MIEHRITFTEEELVASATQDNLSILALTKFLRSLPSDQRGFFKDCRIEAVIPIYMPRTSAERVQGCLFHGKRERVRGG